MLNTTKVRTLKRVLKEGRYVIVTITTIMHILMSKVVEVGKKAQEE